MKRRDRLAQLPKNRFDLCLTGETFPNPVLNSHPTTVLLHDVVAMLCHVATNESWKIFPVLHLPHNAYLVHQSKTFVVVLLYVVSFEYFDGYYLSS